MPDSVRIVIADDHPVVRRGLTYTLREDPALELVGEAGDGRQALELIRTLAPDVILLDIDMPLLDGFGVTREVVKAQMQTRVVFMTLHNEEDMLHAALEAGGRGYLLKDNATEDVIAAIRGVMAGGIYIAPAMTQHLLGRRSEAAGVVAEPQTPEQSAIAALTPSERRILSLIADGKASKEIADVVGIHYRTVENHRTNICRKLQIDGSNALLRFALQYKALIL